MRNNNQFYALRGVSLDIYKGEILGLLGVNGAGKTTLSSIIATQHPLTEGDVFFEGTSIYHDVSRYRSQIGYCAQKPMFNPYLTLKQNLYFAGCFFNVPLHLLENRLKNLINEFGLRKFENEQIARLSGGYKQRFAIARALIHNPKLVIFDEPTVALDPQVRRQLWEHIKTLKASGVTVILTTHYLDEAEYLSDRVCVLDKGVIKLVDTPYNLKATFQKNNLEAVFLELIEDRDDE